MRHRINEEPWRRNWLMVVSLGTILLILVACGGSPTTPSQATTKLAAKQVLNFPNVGIADAATLDPAQGPDANTGLVVNMIYSGLVKSDKNLNALPDQATWQVSADKKVYTFKLLPTVKFSDGTPVTAQDYVYTWTRALLPATNSGIASFFEANIAGASDLNNGKTQTLQGVQALDDHTLQVTLTQPTPYFLEELTSSLFFPLNQKVINKYGKDWAQQVAGNGVGTGPWMVKEWDHNVKMVLVPNPNYYGNKTRLAEVDMSFVKDLGTAFKSFRTGQSDFIWNLVPSDYLTAKDMPGFVRAPLLQTDLLFFDNTKPPFNRTEVRQAFAYALDKSTLVHAIFKDTVTPASTIIPPGMPGYQPGYAGLSFNAQKAKSLLQSVYPDVSKVPPITFSYPNSQVTPDEAAVFQQMWQTALGIQVKLSSVELNTYNDQTQKHLIQFGFTQWSADFPDPYDWLALNLTSNASNNNGEWKNAEFDSTIAQAETLDGAARIALYNKAEQLAISDVGWLPIDHQAVSAVIPAYVHGVSLNGNGLFFGDWSDVYLLQH